jgi:hypothetical protein
MAEEQAQPNINDIQHLHFELFRRIRLNLLDGEHVVSDLLEWRDLWYSVLPMRFPYPSYKLASFSNSLLYRGSIS